MQRVQSHWRGGRRSGSGAAPLGSASAPCAKFIERDHCRFGSALNWSMATQFPAQGIELIDAQAITDCSIGQHPSRTQAPRPSAKTRTKVRATMIGLNLRMCILTTCEKDPQHPDDMRTVGRSILQGFQRLHLRVRSRRQTASAQRIRPAGRAIPVKSSILTIPPLRHHPPGQPGCDPICLPRQIEALLQLYLWHQQKDRHGGDATPGFGP